MQRKAQEFNKEGKVSFVSKATEIESKARENSVLSPSKLRRGTSRFKNAVSLVVSTTVRARRAKEQASRRAQVPVHKRGTNTLHEAIKKNQELNTKWMHCDDILSPACKIVHQKCMNVGRTELQELLFRQVETLLLTGESTFNVLESKGGYGKSSITNVVLSLAKRVRLTHVRVATDENSMHDPWAVWKPPLADLQDVQAEAHLEDKSPG